jgi:hypothetical protein
VNSPFGHHLGRGRGAHRRRRGTRAGALVAATPPNDPDHVDPPVQLLGVLAAGRDERLAARGAAPLLRPHIDEALFLGVQRGVIPPAMTRRTPALSPHRLARPALPVADHVIAITGVIAGSPLLRRRTEQDPRKVVTCSLSSATCCDSSTTRLFSSTLSTVSAAEHKITTSSPNTYA